MVLALVVGGRAATESIPPPTATVELSATVRAPGGAPTLGWPASGPAALLTADGSVLTSPVADQVVPIASIAKVMTAYLILKDHPLASGATGFNLTITAAQAAELPARTAQNESLVTVHAGQVLSERAALEALLLPSADNIADYLATFDAGSIPAFVTKMNQAATSLGMSRSHFADVSGVDAKTESDAADLLMLGRAALAMPAFAEIVAQPSATVAGIGTLKNYNTLVGTDGFTGVKTGSTIAAGQALMFSVSRPVGGQPVALLGVVLEQHGSGVAGGAIQAARTLADSYYGQLQMRTILPAGTVVATVSRVGQHATLATLQPLRLVTLPGAPVALDVSVQQQPGRRSATVKVRSPGGGPEVQTNTWAVPGAGLGWRLSHLL